MPNHLRCSECNESLLWDRPCRKDGDIVCQRCWEKLGDHEDVLNAEDFPEGSYDEDE